MTAEPAVSQQAGALLRSVASRLSDASWTVSHQLKRISDFVQGHATLSSSCAWLMGVLYGTLSCQSKQCLLTTADQESLLADLDSRVWCTYRRDFSPLPGPERLTSDVGWGCTIRSGQMLMAEVLSRHGLGRTWRRGTDTACSSQEICQLVCEVVDEPEASLSIHRICAYGQHYGIVPGRWLGPWVLCRSLAALVNATPRLNLRVHVVCDPGGGAPTLPLEELHRLVTPDASQVPPPSQSCLVQLTVSELEQPLLPAGHQPPSSSSLAAPTCQQQCIHTQTFPDDSYHLPGRLQAGAMSTENDEEEKEAAITDTTSAADMSLKPEVSSQAQDNILITSAVRDPPQGDSVGLPTTVTEVDNQPQNLLEQSAVPQKAQGDGQAATGTANGLVILVPLTLGLGRMNPIYHPQLLEVLTFPQSVGIVGGRPSASLFFMGHQDNNLLYLDPHTPQPTGPITTQLTSYFCDHIRLMPIAQIDPSLAIGFFCSGPDELDDLARRLDALALKHRTAPLLTVLKAGDMAAQADADQWEPKTIPTAGSTHKRKASQDSEWEML